MTVARIALAGALLSTTACGSPDDATAAGTDSGVEWAQLPQAPAAPALAPCPTGWRPLGSGDEAWCEPWPDGGVLTCADDEAHFPGETECARIGSACPADGWPDGLPEGKQVHYVLAGAASGGSGTRASPYGTIAQALAVAETGSIVALSEGVFDEEVHLPGGVTLWGACVSETRVARSTTTRAAATINVEGSEAEVRNLTVSGPRPGVLTQRGSVHLEDVAISGTSTVGWAVEGAEPSTARNLVVRDTQDDGRRPYGFGVMVDVGGDVEIDRGAFVGNHSCSVIVGQTSTATLRDVAIRDTRSDPAGSGGYGLSVQEGGHLRAERAVVEGSALYAVNAIGDGSNLELEDAVVRDTRPDESGFGGAGLEATRGADVTITRALFERNRWVALQIAEPGATALLTDVVVRDTFAHDSPLDAGYGIGLAVLRGADVTVRRALFTRGRAWGIQVGDASAVFEDVVVRETLSTEADGRVGRGILVGAAAIVQLTRASFERNHEAGVFLTGVGTTATLTDVGIIGTEGRTWDGELGGGLFVEAGAMATVRRVAISENRSLGIRVIGEGSRLVGGDLTIRNTRGSAAAGRYGTGLSASRGASAELEGVLVADNRSAGVLSAHGATMRLARVGITGTREEECAADVCAGSAGGFGAVTVAGAAVELSDFEVSHTDVAGIVLFEGGMDLHRGEVSFNPIGVCVLDEGYDLARLSDEVRFEGNDRNLDSDALPLPEVVDIEADEL